MAKREVPGVREDVAVRPGPPAVPAAFLLFVLQTFFHIPCPPGLYLMLKHLALGMDLGDGDGE